MNNHISSELKKRAIAVAVASCLSVAPWVAHAAGLGKITVLSGLGQPLRAELEVNSSREEMSGLVARLAPADAFKQAGVDYSSVLYDLRFSLEKRPDGKQVVKISSAKPVNEPFLDFLVELNWPTGRLVREYTFLLDPPDVVVKPSSRPASVVDAKLVESVPGGTTPVEKVAAKPEMPAAQKPVLPSVQSAKPKAESAASVSESGETRIAKSGDTLRKIATETQHQGVSLEQMLVGLYQNNPDAFIGKNLNRLKAGAILNIPDKTTVQAVSETEAKKIFVAQSGDWNAYRQKAATAAASSPVKEDAASQQAGGKITARVEEKALPKEQSKDQVKVSRSDQMGKSPATAGYSEEDRIAKDKAIKEANDRVSLLEKNVNELQKLVEMKNQKLAELQQLSASKPQEIKPSAPKEEAKPVEAVKPVEAPTPAEAAKPVEPPPAPPVVAPKPLPKPVVAPPPPPPEPDFVETLLADPVTTAGGGGILALLLGYFLYKRRRSAVDTSNTPPQTGDFSQTGPGTIDTDEVDPVAEADVYMAYGRDAQAEEILLEALQKDPQRIAIHVKLLEIYANRHSLKQFETLASELYAQTAGVGQEWDKAAALGARLDPANPLYSAALAQAAPLAAPVFDADATVVVSPEKAQAVVKEVSFDLPSTTEELPPVDQAVASDLPPVIEAPSAEEDVDDLAGLDFDLGASIVNPAPVEAEDETPLQIDVPEPVKLEEEAPADNALDFDLGISPLVEDGVKPESPAGSEAEVIDFDIEIAEESPAETPDFSPEGTLVVSNSHSLMPEPMDEVEFEIAPPATTDSMVDFELDMGADASEAPPEQPVVEAAPEPLPLAIDDVDADSLEFDMTLTDSTVLGQPSSPPNFDITSINLDLAVSDEPDQPAPEPVADEISFESMVAEPASGSVDAAMREEISTKLDLAKAYEEMGDLEGARELLSEVAAEGPADLSTEAKEILARIGS